MSDTRLATRAFNGLLVPAPGTYEVDTTHSHVGFSVRHLMVAKVRGQFTSFRGTIRIAENPAQSSATSLIDVASIDTHDDQRDAHLRSADFFDVDNYPQMTYHTTHIALAGDGSERWAVTGDLTIKDVTRPVMLWVTFEGGTIDPWGNTRIALTATGEIDREEWGLTWNQALETGGVVLGKKVTLDIEVEAIRQAEDRRPS
jgi:polyisoprenoid-binding protein YceI